MNASGVSTAGAARERFAFEKPGDDFPYYRGSPRTLTDRQWLAVLLALAVGVAALVCPWPVFAGTVGAWVQVSIFTGLPLGALMYVTGGDWTALFRKVGAREVAWMLGFGLLNIVVSAIVGLLLSQVMDFTPNRIAQELSHLSHAEAGGVLLRTLPQLFGEELLTMLPFLALLSYCHGRLAMSRRGSIWLAWAISSLVFGAVHLPTYEWNWVQCFVIIGIARMVLTLAYLKSKNLWVSTGAHVVTDWSYFAIGMLASP